MSPGPLYGENSLIGRAPRCDRGPCGFDSRFLPQVRPTIGRGTFEAWSNEVKQSPQDVDRSEQLSGRQLLEHKC